MPTKHIKKETWVTIQEICLKLTLQRQKVLREADVLDEIILEGVKEIEKKLV